MGAKPIAIFLFLAMGCSAPALNQVELNEFGLSIQFPHGMRVCPSYSGDHLVGYFASLDSGLDCKSLLSQPPTRVLSINASYNSAFYRSLDESLPSRCQPVELPFYGAHWNRRVSGSEAISCVSRDSNGVVFSVVTQSGRWDGFPADGAEGKTAKVIYLFSVGTDQKHLKEDLRAFETFLENASIEPGLR